MEIYASRDDAIDTIIRRPLSVADNTDDFTEDHIEAIAQRIIHARPERSGGYVGADLEGNSISPDAFWNMVLAYGPDSDDFEFALEQGPSDGETEVLDVVICGRLEGIVDRISVAASEDREPYLAALAEAGWTLVNPLALGESLALPQAVKYAPDTQ